MIWLSGLYRACLTLCTWRLFFFVYNRSCELCVNSLPATWSKFNLGSWFFFSGRNWRARLEAMIFLAYCALKAWRMILGSMFAGRNIFSISRKRRESFSRPSTRINIINQYHNNKFTLYWLSTKGSHPELHSTEHHDLSSYLAIASFIRLISSSSILTRSSMSFWSFDAFLSA